MTPGKTGVGGSETFDDWKDSAWRPSNRFSPLVADSSSDLGYESDSSGDSPRGGRVSSRGSPPGSTSSGDSSGSRRRAYKIRRLLKVVRMLSDQVKSLTEFVGGNGVPIPPPSRSSSKILSSRHKRELPASGSGKPFGQGCVEVVTGQLKPRATTVRPVTTDESLCSYLSEPNSIQLIDAKPEIDERLYGPIRAGLVVVSNVLACGFLLFRSRYPSSPPSLSPRALGCVVAFSAVVCAYNLYYTDAIQRVLVAGDDS